jgi:hypothetical protein
MALFQGVTRVEGSRSNTHLIKSGHGSPAEEWVLDQQFKDNDMSGVFKGGVLFNYEYGGPGMTDVVIPKGRVVANGKSIKSFVTKKYRSTITLPGMSLTGNPIGMVPYNITKDYLQIDKFGGNQPSIITQDYVALPYIPSVTGDIHFTKSGVLAEEQALTVDLKMPWGAVIGADIKEGDYVKTTPSGRLTKWDKATDSPLDVVGQVLASDLNSEPWGWEKWMLWDEAARNDDNAFINRSGASNLPSDAGYPYDPTYTEGNTIFQQYQSTLINNPTGIPGLHDGSGNFLGYGKNDTLFADMPLGTTPTTVAADTLMAFQAVDYAGGILKNLQNGVTVKIDGVEVDASRLTIDYARGTITVKLAAADANKPVTASYKAYQYGTPSYMDFKGVIGSLFVLLKR